MPYGESVILFVPVDKTYMLRSSKSLVVAIVHRFVLIYESCIVSDAGIYLIHKAVGLDAVLPCKEFVPAGKDPHLHKIGGAACREVKKRYISRHVLFVNLLPDRRSLFEDRIRRLKYPVRFTEMKGYGHTGYNYAAAPDGSLVYPPMIEAFVRAAGELAERADS